MKSQIQKIRAIEAAGWVQSKDEPGFWIPPPGTAWGDMWSPERAFYLLTRGNASRDLAARGWDVAPEYIKVGGRPSLQDNVLHDVKAPKFITIRSALRLEGLPPISGYENVAVERAR